MKDEIPGPFQNIPLGSVIRQHRIGSKCIVSWLAGPDGIWSEAGGISPLQGGVDPMQARVYYRCRGGNTPPDIRIVLPDDSPFRKSRSGFRQGESKSFDHNRNPVFQVKLLYALKTGRYDDRIDAVMDMPRTSWEGTTTAEVLSEQEKTALDPLRYQNLVGREMVRSASLPGGLSDWILWEKVADAAAAFTLEKLNQGESKEPDEELGSFLKTVRLTTAEFSGLPAKDHVRKRWEKGTEKSWREVHATLGFKWLPPLTAWNKEWRLALLESGFGG